MPPYSAAFFMEWRMQMKFYLAPLEGLTGYIYRNAMERYFPGVDRYFTPFIAPDQNKILRTKEQRDVLPANNEVKNLVPQILTNNADHFIRTTEALQDLGYEEVNLNLGCPSGTVVSRGRGSGFLAYPDELDRFLEQIFEGSRTRISIKTRVGRDNADDAFRLMEIYRKYPLSELIIHPRTRSEFYRGVPNLDLFGDLARWWEESFEQDEAAEGKELSCAGMGASGEGMNFSGDREDFSCVGTGASGRTKSSHTKITLCYNGNIMSTKDYQTFTERFPNIDCVMLGRGAIANPGLIRQLKTGVPTDKKNLRAFHDEILEAQREMVHEDKNAMFRMKEMWIYMIHLFGPTAEEKSEYALSGSRTVEKCGKKIRKAQSLMEYKCAVDQLFAECELLYDGPKKWNLPQK